MMLYTPKRFGLTASTSATQSLISHRTFSMPSSMTPSESSTKDRPTTAAPLSFDVAWLLGEKDQPDPLPDRDAIQSARKNVRTPRRRRLSLNLLASALVIGSIAAVASIATPEPFQNVISWFSNPALPTQSPTQPDGSTELPETDSREANETIEAILALQEFAAQSDGKPNPTQKR